MGNDYIRPSHDLVKSSHTNLIAYSSFVSRGLVLANNIISLASNNETSNPMVAVVDNLIEEHKVIKEYYENGKLQWEATFKNGKRDGVCKAYYETGSIDFQVSEFGDSLEQIKPLLAKLGQPIDKFVDIREAVDWLNSSTELYQIYIKHIETNKVKRNIRKILPQNFKSKEKYQLILLASTAAGKELKREILNDLYPQEAPKMSEKGPLKSEGNYKDGKAEGICKTYYENGKLQSEMIFKDGKQVEDSKVYYENELLI